ncbi:MAG: FecR domain-containing protein [Cyclobacteriaceae bacterium]|nr:FecR domain-containing protein [Cyclobacteriaceae bacterium SS2]
MEELIYKYVRNKLTKAEKLRLQEWINEDPENARLFKNFIGHWKLSDFDVDLLKHKVWQKMPHQNGSPSYEREIFSWTWLKVAAVLVAVLGISFYLLKDQITLDDQVAIVDKPTIIEKVAERGQKLTVKLPDGSMVKLNSDSRISYLSNFGDQSRDIQLTGEAFFEVERDETRPFKIFSGNLEVEVLGTSFNVNAYPDQQAASVAVRTGKVSVSNSAKTLGTVLIKQEKLIFSNANGSFSKQAISDAQLAYGWIDNYLSFNDLNLEEAMALIGKWFDKEYVIMNKRNTNKQITAKFNNPSLKNVMENLAYSYEFKYEINENGIVIK